MHRKGDDGDGRRERADEFLLYFPLFGCDDVFLMFGGREECEALRKEREGHGEGAEEDGGSYLFLLYAEETKAVKWLNMGRGREEEREEPGEAASVQAGHLEHQTRLDKKPP